MNLIDRFWKWPDGWVWRKTRGVSDRSRRVRFRLFMQTMQPGPTDRVLDVGAGEGDAAKVNFFEATYPWRHRVTAVALEDLPLFRQTFSDVKLVIADGRNLPFADRSFDLYYSNAVLEHVGTTEEQRRFLSEACRVSKRVFLSTPNRWFPIDSHTMIPFAHWLPLGVRNTIYRLFGRDYYASEERLHLIGLRDLCALKPKGVTMRAYPQRMFGLVANWNIVLKREG
jgi:SAM-dependent methyltransferase